MTKLYIKHIKKVSKVNIFGKPIDHDEYYVIAKKKFGFFPVYLKIINEDKFTWCYDNNVEVKFVLALCNATMYADRVYAEQLLDSILKEPNKYVLT